MNGYQPQQRGLIIARPGLIRGARAAPLCARSPPSPLSFEDSTSSTNDVFGDCVIRMADA